MFGDPAVSLGAAPERKLVNAGIANVGDLLALNVRELLLLPGIGPGTVEQVVAALEAAGLSLAVDPYAAYECARHSASARDAELRSYFLCDVCRNDYAQLSFGGRAPEWVSGEGLDGYCGHCNELTQVRITQWMLCGTCDRVVRSIGRGKASARYVQAVWETEFGPSSGLVLAETDPVEMRPRGKRSDVGRIATADFEAARVGTPGVTVLGLELKTGRGALPGAGIGNPMAQFQLDTTDCDDITAAALDLGAPVFLVHAQVIGRAHPPTERFEGVGLWWARPWDLLPHLLRVQRRPRETRDAAYFRTAAFRPFSEFPAYVENDLAADIALMNSSGFPQLYAR